MCLAIPSRVVSTDGITAVVDVCGARREASLMLLPEAVAPGDFVLVHAGFAMQTVDRETAEQSLSFFSRLVQAAAAAGEHPDEVPEEYREMFARGSIAWGEPGKREP
ncbi:MAG TPA: HypC/HybG/HupF family hydrogenase formation chaperone [Candidatus Methanoperedens sp.]|nr:HypC/HybG/HupF family hydrogenase formation chaperone [Candidatus Methanoperedens sp.]